MSPPQSRAGTGRGLEVAAGLLFLLAAGAHGSLTAEHFAEWWGYGLFFLFSGALQAVWGLALLTRAINPKDSGVHWHRLLTWFYVLGIAGNLFTIVLYVVTRTYGIPFFGTQAGEVEAVAPIDVVTKIAEAVTVVLLIILLRRHRRQPSEVEPPAQGPKDGTHRA